MAEPYLQAMQHSHFHAQAVLKKRAQKRALGAIEAEYGYTAPQPVLSCRSVDIDLHGTRTYRARSAGDIIDEQHQLIQHIYVAARNAISAPPERIQSRAPSKSKETSIRFLSVSNSPSSTRPHSQATTVRSTTTTATSTRSRSRASSYGSSTPKLYKHKGGYMKLIVDPELSATSAAYKEANSELHKQWIEKQREEGKSQALVGTGLNPLNPKGSTQWLSFAGSQREKSEGLIDSFTAIKDEYFSIDSNTGSHVAKQLNKGDKIRIGVNGQEPFLTRRKRTENAVDKKKAMKKAMSFSPPEIIPLCWTDQVNFPNTRVIESKSPRAPPVPANLCETHPVVFKKLIDLNDTRPGSSKSSNGSLSNQHGFRIKARSKQRIGIDGRESQNSTVTNITIDQRTDESDEELDSMSIEEILDRKLGPRRKEQRSPYGEATVTAFRADSASTVRTGTGQDDEEVPRRITDIQMRRKSSDIGSPRSLPPKPDSGRSVISTTHPATLVSADVGALCVTTNGAAPQQQERKKSGRAASGKRPPPAKPSLHKSTAAQGASIGNTQDGEPEYIQIVQPLDTGIAHPPSTSDSPTTKVIQSVKQYNDVSSNHSIPPPSSPVGEQSAALQLQTEEALEEGAKRAVSPTKELLAAQTEKEVSAQKYAFNIPTADMLSDSTSMFSEHDNALSDEHGDVVKTFALSKPRQTPVQEEDGEDESTCALHMETRNEEADTQTITHDNEGQTVTELERQTVTEPEES